jgi:hypothetical protein
MSSWKPAWVWEPARHIAMVLLAFVLISCGWQRKASFQGPSNVTVEFDQPFPINAAAIRVLLKKDQRIITLANLKGDTYLSFADVWFSQDGRFVAAYACTSGPKLQLAYDLSAGKAIAFDILRSQLAKHVVVKYRMSRSDTLSDEEILNRACLEGSQAFVDKHPDAEAF